MNTPAEFAGLRQLTASDAEAFSALRRAVTAENPVQMGLSMEEELGRPIQSFRAQLSAPAPSAVFGAFVDAQLVATAAVSPAGAFKSSGHKMVMWGVFTHPAFRRRGLCRALVSAALDHAFQAGVRRVNLLVYLPNDAAVALYRSLEFVEFGREPEAIQLGGTCFDGLHMSLAAPRHDNSRDGRLSRTSMNHPNPDVPAAAPEAHVAADGQSSKDLRPQRLVFGILVLLQSLATLIYSGLYVDLTRTGAIGFLSFLGAAMGSLCLYGATAMVALGRARGFMGFALAAVLLGSSVRTWSLGYAWGWVIASGAVLAVFGALLVRAMKVRT